MENSNPNSLYFMESFFNILIKIDNKLKERFNLVEDFSLENKYRYVEYLKNIDNFENFIKEYLKEGLVEENNSINNTIQFQLYHYHVYEKLQIIVNSKTRKQMVSTFNLRPNGVYIQ